jgi:hypothetical protein
MRCVSKRCCEGDLPCPTPDICGSAEFGDGAYRVVRRAILMGSAWFVLWAIISAWEYLNGLAG